jgi:hypothetical protein
MCTHPLVQVFVQVMLYAMIVFARRVAIYPSAFQAGLPTAHQNQRCAAPALSLWAVSIYPRTVKPLFFVSVAIV